MSLLFMDSFDHYATADITKKWSANTGGTIVAASGRRSSASMQFTHGSINAVNGTGKALSSVSSTVIMGAAVKIGTTTNYAAIFEISNASGAICSVGMNMDRTVFVKRGNWSAGFGTLLGTSTATIPVSSFVYLEMKALIHASTGTIEVRMDNNVILSLTGQNTAGVAGQWASAIVGHISSGNIDSSTYTINFDDLYVADGSGSAPWNDYVGDCRVDLRKPTGASADGAGHTQWAPSTGSNWQNVDDAAPNDDTDYNSSTTTGHVDTFVVEDAPVVGAAIHAVQHILSAKKTDAGLCTIAPIVRHSSVDYPGTNVNPSTAYAYALQVLPTNPGTGVAWTEAGFNAAEFGYKRIA